MRALTLERGTNCESRKALIKGILPLQGTFVSKVSFVSFVSSFL